jgi:2-C-methyl-D-erythritol 4-phosphate cytidylyltransferase
MPARYWLVMPAAGTGRRFGDRIPKQYSPLHGRTVLEWALSPFLSDPRCAGAVVTIAPSDTWWPKVSERISPVIVAPGGSERCESVRSGLQALNRKAQPGDWVLVHDAARPCLSAADRDRLLEQGASHAVGALLAIRTADTLKRGRDQIVEETVDRTDLWRACTPQMFRYGPLCEALDRAIASKRYPTDEAQAFEWLGHKPLLVEGSGNNIKITSPDDLALADALLAARERPSKPARGA